MLSLVQSYQPNYVTKPKFGIAFSQPFNTVLGLGALEARALRSPSLIADLWHGLERQGKILESPHASTLEDGVLELAARVKKTNRRF